MEERTSRNQFQPFRFWMPSWTSPNGRTWRPTPNRQRSIAGSSSQPSAQAKPISPMPTSASPRPTAARKGSQQPCMNVPHKHHSAQPHPRDQNSRPPVQSRTKIKSPSTMREASKAPVQIQPSSRVAQVKSRPPLKCFLPETKSNPTNQPISQTITSPSSAITLLHKLQAQATSVEEDTKLSSKSSANPVRRESNLRHVTVNAMEKPEPSQLHNVEDTSKQSEDSDLKPESVNIKTEVASVSSDVNIEQRRSSNEKERKITIFPVSKDSFTDGKRAIYEEEIKEGLSTLKQKITAANSGQGRSKGSSVNVITLAGKNNGASMVIGYDDKLGEDNRNGETAFASSINNNVQSINNSAIEQSSCSVRHPGVHLKVSNRSSETLASDKAMKPQNTEPRTFAPLQGQMTSQEPRIRRRCLRALFMESSESDIENPPKASTSWMPLQL
ncbi:uncharacterized protein LOC122011245 [Zingiber officinale]|nr:uncharacterized protein LOC122011245 [Zingiber officinale]